MKHYNHRWNATREAPPFHSAVPAEIKRRGRTRNGQRKVGSAFMVCNFFVIFFVRLYFVKLVWHWMSVQTLTPAGANHAKTPVHFLERITVGEKSGILTIIQSYTLDCRFESSVNQIIRRGGTQSSPNTVQCFSCKIVPRKPVTNPPQSMTTLTREKFTVRVHLTTVCAQESYMKK